MLLKPGSSEAMVSKVTAAPLPGESTESCWAPGFLRSAVLPIPLDAPVTSKTHSFPTSPKTKNFPLNSG
jgi:hypothetical protein